MVSAAELVVFDMDRNVAGRIYRTDRGTANRPKQTKDRKETTTNTKKDQERTQS